MACHYNTEPNGSVCSRHTRCVLRRRGRGAPAKRFDLTLTGLKKHVGVLEHARLVTTRKQGRVRTCSLGPRRLQDVTAWLERYRQLWDARFDALEDVVEELKRKEQVHERPRQAGKSEPTR